MPVSHPSVILVPIPAKVATHPSTPPPSLSSLAAHTASNMYYDKMFILFSAKIHLAIMEYRQAAEEKLESPARKSQGGARGVPAAGRDEWRLARRPLGRAGLGGEGWWPAVLSLFN